MDNAIYVREVFIVKNGLVYARIFIIFFFVESFGVFILNHVFS